MREVSPVDRAKAVVAYFPQIPSGIRERVEAIIARAIMRALNEQLLALEQEAEKTANRFIGRGKQNKFGEPDAVRFHSEWADQLRRLRVGETSSPNHWRDLNLTKLRSKWGAFSATHSEAKDQKFIE